jgi:hypothetical protein
MTDKNVSIPCYKGTLLDNVAELEKLCDFKLGVAEKILICETGILEPILSILSDSEIVVSVSNQSEDGKTIKRYTDLIGKKTRVVLIYAESLIQIDLLPHHIIETILQRKRGIGTILTESGLEFRKRIIEVGYLPEIKSVYRVYEIISGGKIVMQIKERFDRQVIQSLV